jgi:WD40 repeat protein
VPGLAIDELWLAPDAAVVATLSGPDSTGSSSLLFLDTATGAHRGAVCVGAEQLVTLSADWSIGASLNWLSGEISVWRPGDGDPVGRLKPHRDRSVHALALADDGEIGASIGAGGLVALWRPRDGVVVGGIEPTSPIDPETCALSFSPDGRLLAVRTDGDSVELWTTTPLTFLDHLPETGEPVFSPDGRWAAASGAGVSLYDIRAGTAAVMLPGRGPLAFTPDGSLLVVGTPDGNTAVWRTDAAQPVGYLAGGSPRALSPDGRVLALSGPGRDLHLVDVPTGATLARLTGHRGEVQSLAVGPGGRVVVAGCSDATLRVWAAL